MITLLLLSKEFGDNIMYNKLEEMLGIKYRMIAFVRHPDSRYSSDFARMLITKINMATSIEQLSVIVRKHQGFRIMNIVLGN